MWAVPWRARRLADAADGARRCCLRCILRLPGLRARTGWRRASTLTSTTLSFTSRMPPPSCSVRVAHTDPPVLPTCPMNYNPSCSNRVDRGRSGVACPTVINLGGMPAHPHSALTLPVSARAPTRTRPATTPPLSPPGTARRDTTRQSAIEFISDYFSDVVNRRHVAFREFACRCPASTPSLLKWAFLSCGLGTEGACVIKIRTSPLYPTKLHGPLFFGGLDVSRHQRDAAQPPVLPPRLLVRLP